MARRRSLGRYPLEPYQAPVYLKLWIALVILAGCSSVQWQKPGATPENIDADLRACNSAAEAVPTVPFPRSPLGNDMNPADRDADRQFQLAQRVDACMRQRGYSLNSK
jgi:hypothetical protein